jgi:Ni/Fe-hydrogenase subunit HybB-like protein
MYVVLKHRLHALWWTPITPLLFFLQALFGGLAAAVIVAKLTQERLGMRVDGKLLRTMGRLIAILLALFLLCRIGDWVVAGEIGLLFTSGSYSLLIWAELILGALLPLGILFSKLGRRTEGVFWASVWVLAGLFAYRVAVGWIALEAPSWAVYVPHWMEVMSSVGIAAAAVLAYYVIARTLKLFPEHGHSH